MKSKASKAFSHRFEVLGKSVPTIAVAALFFIGAGSAALLDSYGTVEGTATVDQAITLNDDDPANPSGSFTFAFDGQQTAGETVAETHSVSNNADVEASYDFSSTCKNDGTADSESPTASTSVDWADECNGIDTTYAEYFDSAGADLGDYEVPESSECDVTVSTVSGLKSATTDSANTDSTVCVEGGQYDITSSSGVDVTVSGLHLRAGTDPTGSNPVEIVHSPGSVTGQAAVMVSASGTVVEGFNIVRNANSARTDGDSHAQGVRLEAGNSVVRYNDVTVNRDGNNHMAGINVIDNDNSDFSNVTVSDNRVSGAYGGLLASTFYSNTFSGVDMVENTVAGNAYGIVFKTHESSDQPTDVTADYNEISGNGVGVYVTGTGETFDGYNVNDFDATEASLTGNVFGVNDENDAENWGANTLDLSDHWFGTDGIQTLGTVTANYQEKGDRTLQSGETDTFGVVNTFAINLVPTDYTLSTQVVPTGAGYESP